jgi:hypothetical protein
MACCETSWLLSTLLVLDLTTSDSSTRRSRTINCAVSATATRCAQLAVARPRSSSRGSSGTRTRCSCSRSTDASCPASRTAGRCTAIQHSSAVWNGLGVARSDNGRAKSSDLYSTPTDSSQALRHLDARHRSAWSSSVSPCLTAILRDYIRSHWSKRTPTPSTRSHYFGTFVPTLRSSSTESGVVMA